MNYIILDTETTGLPDKKTGTWPKLISIAIIHAFITPSDEMEIYSEDEYYILDWVDELQEDTSKFLNLDKGTVRKRGIQFDMVKTKITNLIKECGSDDVTFVAHNAEFDYNVLKTCGLDLSPYKWVCTMKNGQLRLNQDKYPKLSELAKFYNIPVDNDKLHGALYDTRICTHVLYCMKTNNFNTLVKDVRVLELRNRDVEIYLQ